jgi:hypothetical protein
VSGRSRHPVKELEAVLRDAESRRWRVTKTKTGYFKLWCPCSGRHMKTVHLTPSDPNYERNVRKWLGRQPCWDDKEAGR